MGRRPGNAARVIDLNGRPHLRCCSCERILPTEDFHLNRKPYADGSPHWESHCRNCKRAYMRNWEGRNKDRRRAQSRLREYGVSIQDQAEMIRFQNGMCAACLDPLPDKPKGIHLDHHHESGRIRGFVCDKCNWIIGACGENVQRLVRIGQYLQLHESLRDFQHRFAQIDRTQLEAHPEWPLWRLMP